MNEIKDKFEEYWINFEIKTSGCSYKEAKKKFEEWKYKNNQKYKMELDEFFDEIHPY